MQTLKIGRAGSWVVPRSLRVMFRPSDRVGWFREGDMIILKRVNPPRLSGIANRVRGTAAPLKEIVKEVHAYRKEKRGE